MFVAGATGRLGARIVRELLGLGFRVRAGVRNADKADTYLSIASSYGLLSAEELGRLTVVPCDLERPDTLVTAIGAASKVVCAAGAAESELGDFSAPRRIDGEGAAALVRAAASTGAVQQFVLVTSLGTGKVGFPAAALNLFGGVLLYKRKAEEALEASGMPYVIVRPGAVWGVDGVVSVRMVGCGAVRWGGVGWGEVARDSFGCWKPAPHSDTGSPAFHLPLP